MASRKNFRPRITDDELAGAIGILLRTGVFASACIVLGGGIVYLAQHQSDAPPFRNFAVEPSNLRAVPGIVRSALDLRSDAIIQFGLLLLIATPIARVLAAAVGFCLERDWLYLVISLLVIAVLSYSISQAL